MNVGGFLFLDFAAICLRKRRYITYLHKFYDNNQDYKMGEVECTITV